MPKQDVRREIRRRRERPCVLLAVAKSGYPWCQRLFSLSREKGWRIWSLQDRAGAVPQDFVPQGAIVQTIPTSKLVRGLLKQGCSVVRIGSLPHPRDERVPAIMYDQSAAGRLAADHFVEREP